MEESSGNFKNVPKKNTSLGRIMGFRQYTVHPRCKPKSLQPACTKFSNFVPIPNRSIVTTPTFIISVSSMKQDKTWRLAFDKNITVFLKTIFPYTIDLLILHLHVSTFCFGLGFKVVTLVLLYGQRYV